MEIGLVDTTADIKRIAPLYESIAERVFVYGKQKETDVVRTLGSSQIVTLHECTITSSVTCLVIMLLKKFFNR